MMLPVLEWLGRSSNNYISSGWNLIALDVHPAEPIGQS